MRSQSLARISTALGYQGSKRFSKARRAASASARLGGVDDLLEQVASRGLFPFREPVEDVSHLMVPAPLLPRFGPDFTGGRPDPGEPIGQDELGRLDPSSLQVPEDRTPGFRGFPVSHTTARISFVPSLRAPMTTRSAALSFSSPAFTYTPSAQR